VNLTKGLGTGGDPELGHQAVLEAEEPIREAIKGHRIVFVCAGLGGGTGSGAAPIVTRIAREEGAFVVVFATMPFAFEGKRRRDQAETALNELAVLSNALVTFDNAVLVGPGLTRDVRLVKAAPAGAPRVRWLTIPEATAVLDALPEPYRALHALLMATGADVGAALYLRVRDVDLEKGEVLIRGTKSHDRERTRRLLHEWAASRFWAYFRTRPKFGAAMVFDIVKAGEPREKYRATDRALTALQSATAAVKVTDYTSKDHRHTFAVQALKDGYSYSVVSFQLGHADTTLVHRVYGKFVPDAADYTRRTTVQADTPASAATAAG
jgi:integrase